MSLGRFQHPEKDLVNSDSTSWVKRPTGGKAVLHGHDLTVSLAMPLLVLAIEERSVKGVYRKVVKSLIEGFRACGVDADLGERTAFNLRGRKTADCFALVSPNDIIDKGDGTKLCGVALRVTERAVLLQASIPLRVSEVDPASLIRQGTFHPVANWSNTNFNSGVERAFEAMLLAPVS